MPVAPGDRLPDVKIRVVTEDQPSDVSLAGAAEGKTIAIVGVPGAFTPTCSLNHLPGYVENEAALKAKGVDDIYILSVNDHFVMKAWAKASNALGKLHFIADWNGSVSRALGVEIDLAVAGLGKRSTRFSLLARDGVVSHVNVEPKPGVDVSSAATMLEQL
ncbi:MAG TPA: redoxin family protein [Rhizobiaceae bacterium]|nr:redoxin family protein [Rhizobiaceae bacterium]